MSEDKAQASSLPSFLQRNDNNDYDEIPTAPLVLAAIVVIGFVAYAMRYLSNEQAEAAARENAQAAKRAARKAKKGKPLTEGDKVVDDPDAESLGALKGALLWLLSMIRDVLLLVAVAMLVVECWRFIPRARVLPCHHVLGRPDDGTKCVTVPGHDEPFECSQASRPSPRGTFPTFEQHVTRNCFSELPKGVLRKSSQAYYWDSSGSSWFKQGLMGSLFYRPWSYSQFVAPHKAGGASVAILPIQFEAQLSAFYAVYNSTVLEEEPDKLLNIVAKRDALKSAAAKTSYEAKTLAALHTKYNTGQMGAQISPIEGGIDCAGATLSSFQFILPRGLLDKWSHLKVDVLPDLYYWVSPGQY